MVHAVTSVMGSEWHRSRAGDVFLSSVIGTGVTLLPSVGNLPDGHDYLLDDRRWEYTLYQYSVSPN